MYNEHTHSYLYSRRRRLRWNRKRKRQLMIEQLALLAASTIIGYIIIENVALTFLNHIL